MSTQQYVYHWFTLSSVPHCVTIECVTLVYCTKCTTLCINRMCDTGTMCTTGPLYHLYGILDQQYVYHWSTGPIVPHCGSIVCVPLVCWTYCTTFWTNSIGTTGLLYQLYHFVDQQYMYYWSDGPIVPQCGPIVCVPPVCWTISILILLWYPQPPCQPAVWCTT